MKKRYTIFFVLLLAQFVLYGCLYRRPHSEPPPIPQIEGVSEGRTYGRDVIIEVKSDEGIQVETLIDGQKYIPGTPYGEEGDHKLRVSATNTDNGMSSHVEISFTIDKKPPPVPVPRIISNKGVYYQSVPIKVIEVAGVEYSAFVDGTPFPIGDDFTQIGEHELVLQARKTSNGLISRSVTQFILKSQEEKYLDYFLEIALMNEYNENESVIKKWVENLDIKVKGSPSQEDMDTLKHVLKELNELIKPIELRLVDKAQNVEVFFVPESRFHEYVPEYEPINQGFFTAWEDANHEIYRAIVLISSEGISQKERSHLIREEITQILGLMNDSWKYNDSIFYQGWTAFNSFSEIDRKLIQMLYREDIRPGMRRSEVEVLFQDLYERSETADS